MLNLPVAAALTAPPQTTERDAPATRQFEVRADQRRGEDQLFLIWDFYPQRDGCAGTALTIFNSGRSFHTLEVLREFEKDAWVGFHFKDSC
jgi:hypothetical protein